MIGRLTINEEEKKKVKARCNDTHDSSSVLDLSVMTEEKPSGWKEGVVEEGQSNNIPTVVTPLFYRAFMILIMMKWEAGGEWCAVLMAQVMDSTDDQVYKMD